MIFYLPLLSSMINKTNFKRLFKRFVQNQSIRIEYLSIRIIHNFENLQLYFHKIKFIIKFIYLLHLQANYRFGRSAPLSERSDGNSNVNKESSLLFMLQINADSLSQFHSARRHCKSACSASSEITQCKSIVIRLPSVC